VNVLLQGITGSRAYGLATEVSDTDRHGIYALPTRQVLGLRKPEWSQRPDSDTLYWEAGNAIRLALASNPTVLELLYLPEHEFRTELGEALCSLRGSLVSREAVRRSYLRNAESQAAKMRRRMWTMRKMDWRGDEQKELAEIRKRARSVAICLVQGIQLWETGSITVPLTEERRASVSAAEQDPVHLDGLLDFTEALMQREESPLPEAPDTPAAENWLLQVREQNWSRK
jgi:hypothetical protein